MAATIRDVAQHVGVSAATVSRVLREDFRNGFNVSPVTQQKILDAADALKYRPNAAAQAIVRGRTGLIGVIIGSVSESFLDRILSGIQSIAAQQGLAIILYTERSGEKQSADNLLQMVQDRQVDGIIAAHCYLSPKVLEELQGKPFVLLSPQPTPGHTTVHVNDQTGGRLAAEHLLELGHREIAFIGNQSLYSVMRQQGVAQTLKAQGIGLLENISPENGSFLERETWVNAEILTLELLEEHPELTAIVCSDDYTAVGALAAAKKQGLRVPEDLSIVGYDDLFWTAFTDPPLTTVQQPKEEQGIRAVELLQEMMNGAAASEVMLEPQLTVRASTAPVRQK